MTLKKHKLAESISDDFCLLGILSDEPDYKLCWLINEHNKASFKKVDDLEIFNRKFDIVQQHPLFQFDDDNSMLTYRMIVNRSEHGYFLPNLKNIDFLIHIQGDFSEEEIEDVMRSLNSIDAIRMCVPIELKKIREKERLQIW